VKQKLKKLDVLAGYSKACYFQVPVKGTALRYMFVVAKFKSLVGSHSKGHSENGIIHCK